MKQYNQKICFFIKRGICYYKYFAFNMIKKKKQSIISRHLLKVFFIPKVNFHLFLGANSQRLVISYKRFVRDPKQKTLRRGDK